MKTIAVFLIVLLAALHAKVALAVENTEVNVDNDYDLQLNCVAQTENESFALVVKWKRIPMHASLDYKDDFSYELKNLSTQQKLGGYYSDLFHGQADIQDEAGLKFQGGDHVNAVDIMIAQNKTGYELNKFIIEENNAVLHLEFLNGHCN